MPSLAIGPQRRATRSWSSPSRASSQRAQVSARGWTGPTIVDTDISLSRKGSRPKIKRGRNNTIANPDTVSKRNRPPADPGADNDPITSVDGPNDVHEDVSDAKSKASTTGMDKLWVSVAQSDTGSENAHSTTYNVTDIDRTTAVDGLNNDHKVATDAKSKVSTIATNKVGVNMNHDNGVKIATDGLNDDNEDVKDKDESSAINNDNEYDDNSNFEVINDGMDEKKNHVSKVRLYSHCLHVSPHWLLSWL